MLKIQRHGKGMMEVSSCGLSIIIPAFNEAKTIRQNMAKLVAQLDADEIDFQIMLVDDGSSDSTWLELKALSEADKRISCLRFSRNFGKEAAICAGLKAMEGERFLVMDSDLQHPPRYIKGMMELMDETGADIVDGVKADRGEESLAYKLLARGFYKILEAASGLELNSSSDFKLMGKNVVDAICDFPEGRVFFRGLVDWIGFTKVEFLFNVDRREGDVSRFSTKKLIRFAIDSVLSYTSKPLYITVLASLIFFVCAVVLGVQTLINFFTGTAVSGFTTVILLLLIIGSVLALSLGVIGAYISRIYDEVKGRPRYIVQEIRGSCGRRQENE